jgi:hypothetical protein
MDPLDSDKVSASNTISAGDDPQNEFLTYSALGWTGNNLPANFA